MSARSRLCSVLALSLLLTPGLATAEPSAVDCAGQDATECGRRHFEAGTEAFERGDFRAAASEFAVAIQQRPHAVIRFNWALSLARLGQPSAAIAQLRLVLSDAAADKELRARAERELRSAEQALARVTFKLSDPTREQVELDGKQLGKEVMSEVTLDPGVHHVRVISGSSVVLDQEIELAPGERFELRVGERSRRIDVVVVPPDKPVPARPAKPPQKPSVASNRRTLSPVWFYSAAGVTVVLTGATVWSGLDTREALADYERDLPQLTRTQAEARVSDGHSRELRTNLLLAGSLLAAAGTAGLGIWLVDFGGGAEGQVALTPGQLTFAGRF